MGRSSLPRQALPRPPKVGCEGTRQHALEAKFSPSGLVAERDRRHSSRIATRELTPSARLIVAIASLATALSSNHNIRRLTTRDRHRKTTHDSRANGGAWRLPAIEHRLAMHASSSKPVANAPIGTANRPQCRRGRTSQDDNGPRLHDDIYTLIRVLHDARHEAAPLSAQVARITRPRASVRRRGLCKVDAEGSPWD